MPILKKVSTILFAALFIGSGINHFIAAEFYLRMMPPYLPWHTGLVQLSGVAEVVLGVLLFSSRTRALAAWALIALLVLVYPANVFMAQHPEAFPELPEAVLWARLPLQVFFVAWAYWLTRSHGPHR